MCRTAAGWTHRLSRFYGNCLSTPETTDMSQNSVAPAGRAETGTVTAILLAISFSHLLNDTIQSLFPALYPLLKNSFQLSFTQIGLITLTFQLTASLLQPLVGLYTDRRPKPY